MSESNDLTLTQAKEKMREAKSKINEILLRLHQEIGFSVEIEMTTIETGDGGHFEMVDKIRAVLP